MKIKKMREKIAENIWHGGKADNLFKRHENN